jgi:hypothetical protein
MVTIVGIILFCLLLCGIYAIFTAGLGAVVCGALASGVGLGVSAALLALMDEYLHQQCDKLG